MPYAPAAIIKLGLGNSLGHAFNNAQLARQVPDQFAAPDYLHMSISIVQGSPSPAQLQGYEAIVKEAAKKMAMIQSFDTGTIQVEKNGYVKLAVNSPAIEEIMRAMEVEIRKIGLTPISKIPVHITLRVGRFSKDGSLNLADQEFGALERDVRYSPGLQQLENKTFSLAGAEFGAASFVQGVSATLKADWPQASLAQAPSSHVQMQASLGGPRAKVEHAAKPAAADVRPAAPEARERTHHPEEGVIPALVERMLALAKRWAPGMSDDVSAEADTLFRDCQTFKTTHGQYWGRDLDRMQGSRYLVIDFSPPWLKSTRQRAKLKAATVLRPLTFALNEQSVYLPQMTLRPDIDFVNFPSGSQ